MVPTYNPMGGVPGREMPHCLLRRTNGTNIQPLGGVPGREMSHCLLKG